MTSAIVIETDFDHPCPTCGGVKVYKTTRNCVRCMKAQTSRKIKTKAQINAQLRIVHDSDKKKPIRRGPFSLEEIRDEAFKNAELAIMAGVRYQDAERVTQ